MIYFQHGGLVFYGGLIGSFAACYVFLKKRKLQVWQIGDLVAPYLSLGIAITRIGCFLNGCCFGKPTCLPWGVKFPSGSPASNFYGENLAIHPTEIYELIYCFILFLFLLVMKKYKKFHGQIFWIFVLFYSILRSLNETLRGDAERGFYFGLSTSQLIGVFTGLAAVFMLVYLGKNKNEV
jgi:phosphatidylglycerol:prolipoprotein diacylglycerol transferase